MVEMAQIFLRWAAHVFGIFRFSLALMVATSHIIGNLPGLWHGVVAVVGFYILSGYVMDHLIRRKFEGWRRVAAFYRERFNRIAPQYYFWLAVALIVSLVLGWKNTNTNEFRPSDILSYLLLFPLGLQVYLGWVKTLVMEQASSLGIEALFWLVAPAAVASRTVSIGFAFTSIAIMAATGAGWLPGAIYTYYTAPGPAIFFVMGVLLHRRDYITLGIMTACSLITLAASITTAFHLEYLLGILLFVPTIALLRYIEEKSGNRQASAADKALGDASYGCFLAHLSIFAIMTTPLGWTPENAPLWLRLAAVAASCAAGWAGYRWVEKPLRKRLTSAEANTRPSTRPGLSAS